MCCRDKPQRIIKENPNPPQFYKTTSTRQLASFLFLPDKMFVVQAHRLRKQPFRYKKQQLSSLMPRSYTPGDTV